MTMLTMEPAVKSLPNHRSESRGIRKPGRLRSAWTHLACGLWNLGVLAGIKSVSDGVEHPPGSRGETTSPRADSQGSL